MSFSSPISVFVIDDHTLFRRGLIALIAQDAGLRVVGEAGDAGEALRLVPALAPQVILLDNHLPVCWASMPSRACGPHRPAAASSCSP
ncbi:hypothetical protein GY15_03300 [Delftia sp. 670]|nr:hypothetical protein GY15_03300 [Delftia sp. 670]